MDACDAQGLGAQLGTRRKTALPGRHGASSLDQGTGRSALYRKVETVGRWIFKVCGTRRNADLWELSLDVRPGLGVGTLRV